MTFYLTKVWGFETPVGPLQFSSQGWRKNALEKLLPRDLVVLVGTNGEQTPPELRGRLLGIMEPTPEPVMALDFNVQKSPADFVNGDYKWPFGLMNIRAWSLPERPLLSELSSRSFAMHSALGIVPLTEDEANHVKALRWHAEELLQPTASAKARMEKKFGNAKRTAPLPTTKRAGVMHMRQAPAFTYVMQVGAAALNAFKIGWAFDYKDRAGKFNHAAMPELGGLEYKPALVQLWDTAQLAYSMERQLLMNLEDKRHPSNNEIVTRVDSLTIERIWNGSILKIRADCQ